MSDWITETCVHKDSKVRDNLLNARIEQPKDWHLKDTLEARVPTTNDCKFEDVA